MALDPNYQEILTFKTRTTPLLGEAISLIRRGGDSLLNRRTFVFNRLRYIYDDIDELLKTYPGLKTTGLLAGGYQVAKVNKDKALTALNKESPLNEEEMEYITYFSTGMAVFLAELT